MDAVATQKSKEEASEGHGPGKAHEHRDRGLKYPLKTPWEIKTWGTQENGAELRLSLAFELAPDEVTFSFLAALKKERRENVDCDIKDGWGSDKLNSFEGFPSTEQAEGRSPWFTSGRYRLSS